MHPRLLHPTVLLLHPSPRRRPAGRHELPGLPCVEAESWTEAAALVQHARVHVVLTAAGASAGRPPQALRGRSCAFLYRGELLPRVAWQLLGAGERVALARDGEPLAPAVRALAGPVREEGRACPPGLRARLGELGPLPVLDLSVHGVAVRLPSERSVEPVLPGTALPHVTLERDGLLWLQGAAVVRSLTAYQGDHRVGLRLLERVPRDERAADAVSAAQLLQKARRAGVLRVRLSATAQWSHPAEVRLSPQAPGLLLSGVTPPPAPALAEVELEPDGACYRFEAVAQPTEGGLGVHLAPPAFISTHDRRRVDRFPLGGGVTLTCHLPDGAQAHALHPLELSATGCAFLTASPLPLGSQLRFEVGLPSGPRVAVAGEVVSAVREGAQVRQGARFGAVDSRGAVVLARAALAARHPRVSDGASCEPEAVLALLLHSGLIHEGQLELIRPELPEIHRTFTRLARAADSLFQSLVVEHEGTLVGHVSMFLAYRSTWFVQQLAVQPTSARSVFALNQSAADLFGQLPELRHIKIAFFADNSWPSRVFGSFARAIDDGRTSVLRELTESLLYVDAPLPELTGPELEVGPATAAERLAIERSYVEAGQSLLLASDDLTAGALPLEGLAGRYAARELQRGRETFVARVGGEPFAFALLERASPGLNLFEYFNSVQLHWLRGADFRLRCALAAALVRRAQGEAALRERRYLRLFVATGDEPLLGALGLPTGRRILEWTGHRARFREFTEHLDRLFAPLSLAAPRHAPLEAGASAGPA